MTTTPEDQIPGQLELPLFGEAEPFKKTVTFYEVTTVIEKIELSLTVPEEYQDRMAELETHPQLLQKVLQNLVADAYRQDLIDEVKTTIEHSKTTGDSYKIF